MAKEKQIGDMVIALTESQHEFDKAWHECLHNNGKQPERENVFYAKYLIENKGYAKASEVIGEVVERAKRLFCPDCEYDVDEIRSTLDWLEAELKKKYTEEEG